MWLCDRECLEAGYLQCVRGDAVVYLFVEAIARFAGTARSRSKAVPANDRTSGEFDLRAQSALFAVAQGQPPPHGLDQLVGNGQSQAGATRAAIA